MPLEEYKTNLAKLVGAPRIRAHGCKVLVVTPPPIDEIRRAEMDAAQHGRAVRQQARSAAYSQAAREVAAELGEQAAAAAAKEKEGGDAAAGFSVVCVDLAKALMDHAVANTTGWDASQPPLGSAAEAGGRRGYLEQLLPDGLHMSGEAYRVLWGLVEAEIQPRFPNENTEGYVWPGWREAPWLEPGQSVLERRQQNSSE